MSELSPLSAAKRTLIDRCPVLICEYIGRRDDVDPNAGEIAASFDGLSVTYGFGEVDMLVPAYAAHPQEPGLGISRRSHPVMTQHYAMLQRNLLYTGVTRGERLVVLVGHKKAVAIAVRNASGRRRWSKLSEWLRPGTSPSRRIGVAGAGGFSRGIPRAGAGSGPRKPPETPETPETHTSTAFRGFWGFWGP
jgi:UvrD-like helicase C-terminal domain